VVVSGNISEADLLSKDRLRRLRYFPLVLGWVRSLFPSARLSTLSVVSKLLKPPNKVSRPLWRNWPKSKSGMRLWHWSMKHSHTSPDAGIVSTTRRRCWNGACTLAGLGGGPRIRRYVHRSTNKDDLWLKTMEESLKSDEPDTARISRGRRLLANLMSRKQYAKAEPFAHTFAIRKKNGVWRNGSAFAYCCARHQLLTISCRDLSCRIRFVALQDSSIV